MLALDSAIAIPKCDRPVADVLVFDRDGHGDARRPYCREHAALMKKAMLLRKVPYRIEAPDGTETCYAWKDV